MWFQAQSSPPDQVWCFEDDVGWAGDLATFFTRVAKIRGDLVTADTDLRVAHDWWWKDSHSAKFAERFLAPREAERRVSREHVQRFSRRLLDRLHALSRARCSAWRCARRLSFFQSFFLSPRNEAPSHLCAHSPSRVLVLSPSLSTFFFVWETISKKCRARDFYKMMAHTPPSRPRARGTRTTCRSETSVVTVCATEPDLVLARLPPDLQGRPFQHDGRISEEDWRQISKSRSPRKRDKLYHALKF